jgi:ubiquinone/menaquinone biosynthesis C-methylase UbiE
MTRNQSPYEDPDVVAVYDRLAVPIQFAAPARELLSRLRLTAGERVLDVGTGTGAVLVPMTRAVGSGGMAVGLDASVEMLLTNRASSGAPLVSADASGLPFMNAAFDALAASFVISHLGNYTVALAEMARVVRPGGRLGITSWGSGRNELADAWNEVVATFMSLGELKEAFNWMVPHNEFFAQEGNLRGALIDAGLIEVTVHRSEYRVSAGTADYLLLRELSLRGHVVKKKIGPQRWAEFTRDVSAAFRTRFGEHVQYSDEVFIAVGTKG